jgi:hypothetical protein
MKKLLLRGVEAQDIPLRGLEENPKVKPILCAFLALFESASFFV